MTYQIISDGSCDLGAETASQLGVTVVPFYVTFDGIDERKEIEEVGVREFYQEMMDQPGIYPKSSMPSILDFAEAFGQAAAQQQDIICLCITTKFSGSYQSAVNAKQLVQEKYPDIRITVIDTTVNTVLQGLVVKTAVEMQQAGLDYDELIAQLTPLLSSGRIIFTVGDFEYLIHGGRVGKLLSGAVRALNVRPLIILKEGEIFPAGIVRSRDKSKRRLLELCREHFEKIGESPDQYQFIVGYGYDEKEAAQFRNELLLSLQEYSHVQEIPLCQIGATIGVHTGPYPIGLGLLRKYEHA